MLDLLEIALYQAGYRFVRIDGRLSVAQRTSALSTFRNDEACTVLIATITSVGEGWAAVLLPYIVMPFDANVSYSVDLTAASYVHLLEPHWNPMAEEQALDRVHRMGQERDVTATRYITENSIECVSSADFSLFTSSNPG